MRRVLSPHVVFALCVGLAMAGCSQKPAAPTGLATGLGLSADATMTESWDGYPVEAAPETKSIYRPDVHGTFSVENFQGTQPNLSYTHESANGFRNYLAKWHTPNYVYRDAGVGAWAFHDVAGGDNWDLWSSGGIDYGIDAVLTSFQSSHGGMSNTGIYSTSLGANWAGRGWNGRSDRMTLGANAGAFGNERLRYMFWDTCQALRSPTGYNPRSIWGPHSRGIRMIFGYRDNSVDSSRYGQYFWEEWNKGKTLKRAFLDASWRISHGQSPCVLAFGSTQTEAINRRDNERMMSWGAVHSNWGAWAWYSAKSAKAAPGEPQLPYQVAVQDIQSRANDTDTVLQIASELGISVADTRMVQSRPFGLAAVNTANISLVIEPDGDFEMLFDLEAEAAGAPTKAMTPSDAESRARQIVDQFDLAKGQEYELSTVRFTSNQNASEADEETEPAISETTVVFAQMANGLPFIDPDAGQLEITIDHATQKVSHVRSTWRQVVPDYEKSATVRQPKSLDEVRTAALREFEGPPQPDAAGNAGETEALEIVPGSEQIGYYDIGGRATPVYKVLLQDPRYPNTKYHEAVVTLASGS